MAVACHATFGEFIEETHSLNAACLQNSNNNKRDSNNNSWRQQQQWSVSEAMRRVATVGNLQAATPVPLPRLN